MKKKILIIILIITITLSLPIIFILSKEKQENLIKYKRTNDILNNLTIPNIPEEKIEDNKINISNDEDNFIENDTLNKNNASNDIKENINNNSIRQQENSKQNTDQNTIAPNLPQEKYPTSSNSTKDPIEIPKEEPKETPVETPVEIPKIDEELENIKKKCDYFSYTECKNASIEVSNIYALNDENYRNTDCYYYTYKGEIVGYKVRIFFNDGTWRFYDKEN